MMLEENPRDMRLSHQDRNNNSTLAHICPCWRRDRWCPSENRDNSDCTPLRKAIGQTACARDFRSSYPMPIHSKQINMAFWSTPVYCPMASPAIRKAAPTASAPHPIHLQRQFMLLPFQSGSHSNSGQECASAHDYCQSHRRDPTWAQHCQDYPGC